MSYRVGDRLYAYCVNCGRQTSHVVTVDGSAVCAEC